MFSSITFRCQTLILYICNCVNRSARGLTILTKFSNSILVFTPTQNNRVWNSRCLAAAAPAGWLHILHQNSRYPHINRPLGPFALRRVLSWVCIWVIFPQGRQNSILNTIKLQPALEIYDVFMQKHSCSLSLGLSISYHLFNLTFCFWDSRITTLLCQIRVGSPP
jgi:hypothetical protein